MCVRVCVAGSCVFVPFNSFHMHTFVATIRTRNWICSWNFHLLKCTHSSIGNTTSNSIIAKKYANAVHSVWWMGIDYYYLNAHRCKYSRASKSSFREANGNWHFLSVIVHVCNILYSLRNETKSNTMSPYGRNSFTPL